MKDEQIAEQILNHLDYDSRVSSNINVEVVDGIAILRGQVPNLREKFTINDISELVPGVRKVNNLLSVRKPIITVSDEQLQSKVSDFLTWNSDVDSQKLDIVVDDGVVRIVGSVDKMWKKFSVENDIKNLYGVSEVINEIFVIPSQDYEDEVIAEKIIAALNRNSYVDTQNFDITVNEGIVELEGEANSISERNQVFTTACNIEGVIEVNDRVLVL